MGCIFSMKPLLGGIWPLSHSFTFPLLPETPFPFEFDEADSVSDTAVAEEPADTLLRTCRLGGGTGKYMSQTGDGGGVKRDGDPSLVCFCVAIGKVVSTGK